MNQPGTFKKNGATPAKLALVGVLGVVFLAVVVPQMRGKPSGMAPADSPRTKKVKGKEQVGQQSEAGVRLEADASPNLREWSKILLEQVVSYDPLAAPDWYVKAAAVPEAAQLKDDRDEANALALAELEKQGASIVVIANQQRMATIGTQRVKVGDLIKGYQVSSITTEGIVLTDISSD
ncbi:MAG: hypothetical protein MK171_03785 [Pirellulales bacterium]|nr:hypothetical protein [Pirellulales bacterium]